MSSDLTSSGGGSGLATDGSSTGATAQPQTFTNGLKTGATTGLVGVGMTPIAMLDVTAPSTLASIQSVGTQPAAVAAGNGTGAQSGLAVTAAAGGDTSHTQANRFGGVGGSITLTTGSGGQQTGASSGTARGGIGGVFGIAAGNGGNATAVTGTVKGGGGGGIAIGSGSGGTSATSTGGAAGAVTIITGNGGITTAAAASGVGGDITLTAGSGGANSNAAGTAGAAGNVTLDTGSAGVASGGAAAGAGGSVSIGTAAATAIVIGNAAARSTLRGGVAVQVIAKTADYTVTLLDHVITADATGGNITLTLPAASTAFASNAGSEFRIKRLDSGGNTVTIARAGADTIDGGTSTTLAVLAAKTIIAISASAWGIF